MKFSTNWLRDLVPSLAIPPRELMRLITMKTAECEGVEEFAPWLAQVCVARVLETEAIDGTHNVKALIDAGPTFGRKTVVCGAPNCRPGLLTAYVPAGVAVSGKEVKLARISGIESDGMLASGDELGINRDQEGIVEFAAGEPGAPLPGLSPDSVIEVDNKSLNHRPDLWGHFGMSREIAAITGLDLRDPVDMASIPRAGGAWHVDIRDRELCPRYSALVFENVKVEPSPLWLQARLEAAGLKPISNVVDVTNFVMAELAQPLHAFDAGKLHGDTIIVRRAAEGESFDALNGEMYTLAANHLVIADSSGPVALGGVIGGAHSAISESTTRIVLESANFQAAGIRRTSSQLRLRTDASMRFEKAQDPVNTVRGLARAAELLARIIPGIRIVGGLVDQWFPAPPPEPIELPLEWVVRKLGRSIEAEHVQAILESLEFGVKLRKPGVFMVTVPSWRATKDITIKDDLLEEIGRIVGYDTVPPAAPLQPVHRPWINRERIFHHEVRQMCAAQGFTESSNYSFISDEMALRFGFTPEEHLRVANPISVDQALMRRSLLPGIHHNIVDNLRNYDSFRLFEIGNEIHPRSGGGLPDEIPHLMAAICSRDDGAAALYELKRLAACLMPGCEAWPAGARPYEHPARSAELRWRGASLGRIFELHPDLVENARAAIVDLDLRALFELGAPPKKYTPLRRYPTSAFDVSVVAGLRVLCADIGALIRQGAGEYCLSVEYLYSYKGKPLAHDQQSLTFRVTVGANDRTLTSDEVQAVRDRAIAALAAQGLSLR